ncbi:unnamed protein product [Ectocarpus sp. CCAP 1310/34]|nr:unnamed protein product [Ectocarpus sp. CCAP 1310/34]
MSQQEAALATFTDTYTATTRLTVRPASPRGPVGRRNKSGLIDETDSKTTTKGDSESNSSDTRSVVVEVRFSGPQPADRPALLLRSLLKGESVVVHPVSLRRGRQPKSMKAAAKGDERSCIFANVNRSPGVNFMIVCFVSLPPFLSGLVVLVTLCNRLRFLTRAEATRTAWCLLSSRSVIHRVSDLKGIYTVARGRNKMRCFCSDLLADTPDAMLRKRSASKANLPSPNDPRDEGGAGQGRAEDQGLLSDEDNDSDDGLGNPFKGRGILFQAWSRCMDLSRWVPANETNGGKGVAEEDRESRGGPSALKSSTVTIDQGHAADEAESGWNLKMGNDARDELASLWEGGGSNNLSPLIVAPPRSPFRRRASDTALERVAGPALTKAAVSPLTVQAPPTARRTRSAEGLKGSTSESDLRLLLPNRNRPEQTHRAPWSGRDKDHDIAMKFDIGEGGVRSDASAAPRGYGNGLGDKGAAVAASARETGEREKGPSERRAESAINVITVESLREVRTSRRKQEFDFDGRSYQPDNLAKDSPFASVFSVPCSDEEQYLAFTGLGHTGQPLRMLTARVQFSVNSEHTAESVAGGNGRVYGALRYPSMSELWPEICRTSAVRVVQVEDA